MPNRNYVLRYSRPSDVLSISIYKGGERESKQERGAGGSSIRVERLTIACEKSRERESANRAKGCWVANDKATQSPFHSMQVREDHKSLFDNKVDSIYTTFSFVCIYIVTYSIIYSQATTTRETPWTWAVGVERDFARMMRLHFQRARSPLHIYAIRLIYSRLGYNILTTVKESYTPRENNIMHSTTKYFIHNIIYNIYASLLIIPITHFFFI